MAGSEIELIAHLMRRAGFGATRDELEEYAAAGFEATVDGLLETGGPATVDDDLVRRYHPDHTGGLGMAGFDANWVHRMAGGRSPLQEKVALFWHGVFATGYAKLAQGRLLMDQIEMFRRLGMGSLRDLLIALSKQPSMILWLDNHDNHKGAINENYGRELLELFSMGVGNYTEDDVKACATAFTGWSVANTEYMTMRARNDSLWPYGRLNLQFQYRADDHDDSEVTFLGQTGRFTGEDIIDIICRQPATARFISRNLYSFFVADEPPVTQWPYAPPRDPEAVEVLSRAYFDSGFHIGPMLRTLLMSDFFRSDSARYQKVKSPSELVAGVLRLTGESRPGMPRLQVDAQQMGFMGQVLVNPPSVEGWHEGIEWIDSGSLVERVNYASQQFADADGPGVSAMVERFISESGGSVTPEGLVQGALDQMGAISVSESTRAALVDFASPEGDLSLGGGPSGRDRERVVEMLRLVAATPDFQRE